MAVPQASTSSICEHQDLQSHSVANDFDLFVGKSLTDADKLSALENHFKPSKTYRFPVRVEYGKKRSFNPNWMDKHNWLVYSPSKDGVYCKVCAIFGATESDQNSSKLDRLVKSPITFWTTACEKLYDHALKSAVHKTATIKAENFVKIMKAEQSSIDTQLNTAVAQP